MSVALAETKEFYPRTINHETAEFDDLPDCVPVAEMSQDVLVRSQAAKFIGANTVSAVVEVREASAKNLSLQEAIIRSNLGDLEALKMVKANVRTDVIERTIKTGFVTEVPLEVDEIGGIWQHGQSLHDVQSNALKFASNSKKMRPRMHSEVLNSFRTEFLAREAFFDDHSMIVFSLVSDDMNKKEMAEEGFFTDTMSCSIQRTGLNGQNELVLESAFVSGVEMPDAPRHDIQAVIDIALDYGVDLSGKTAAEILGCPLLVHNSLIPNGVLDIVKKYDISAGGTFFGQNKPVADYIEYRELCRQREADLEPVVEMIVEELLADSGALNTPLEATQKLHKISGKRMLAQSIVDEEIDPKVFGQAAVPYIINARLAYSLGDSQALLDNFNQASKVENSSSCPGFGLKVNQDGATTSNSDTSETCEFVSRECPECGKKNVKTIVTKTHISGSCGCSKTKT